MKPITKLATKLATKFAKKAATKLLKKAANKAIGRDEDNAEQIILPTTADGSPLRRPKGFDPFRRK